jgi:ankyrin repeat protein
MAVDPECLHKSLDGCYQSDGFITNKDIDRRIKTLSLGLAEIVPSTNARVVQFIHQSVKDFFNEHGLLLMNKTRKAHLVAPAAYYRLSRSCIQYLGMVVTSKYGAFGKNDKDLFPLLHYATTSWVSHMKLGEPEETSLIDLLGRLKWTIEPLIKPWIEIYWAIEPYSIGCPSRGSNLVHIVSRYGLMNLLSCFLEMDKVDVDSKDEDGRTPLSWAARNGHEAVVKMLLNTGRVDIDVRDRDGRTPLSWAARNGHEAVVKILLDTGKVDVDVRNRNGWTPLSLAAGNGREAVVKMLLDTGKVDVDSKDNAGWTPLSWAARNGREAVVKMLLNTDKVDINAGDKDSRTPLWWAAENSQEAVVKMLLDIGNIDVDYHADRTRS